MKCISSVRSSVKVNGGLLEPFHPTRGIRQGDPISPFLLLFCGEGLTTLLNNYSTSFVDRGVRVCNRSPWISHLFFADDSLIFINANGASARRLSAILEMYDEASGQRVNKEKSAIFFSPCTPEAHRIEVKMGLNIQVEAFSEKYLGLPTAVSKITSEAFEFISDKARSKVNGWAEKKSVLPRERSTYQVIYSVHVDL
jgi:hypothetical protein